MCVDWCRYRTLFAGQGKKALSEPAVISIAEEHGKSAAQILGRWCVQKGLIYIPKSEQEARMVARRALVLAQRCGVFSKIFS